MKTYSAIFATDAWDEATDALIVEFEAMPECNAGELLKLAKIAFAKDIYWAAKEERLLNELEGDCFYVKCIGIFEGKTKINKSGVEICK